MEASGVTSSTSAFTITPSDDVDLTYPTRALYVGSGGDIVLLLWDDTVAVTLKNVLGGSCLPLNVKRIYATDTGASDLVGLR